MTNRLSALMGSSRVNTKDAKETKWGGGELALSVQRQAAQSGKFLSVELSVAVTDR